MCVTSSAGEPLPVTTNVGVGQCAGAAAAGAELRTLNHFITSLQLLDSIIQALNET
jgi:hypothetical protein